MRMSQRRKFAATLLTQIEYDFCNFYIITYKEMNC